MAYLLDRINQQLSKEGYQPRSRQARDWLLSKVNSLKSSRQALLNDTGRLEDDTMIGHMYFYFYEAKMKDKLPYYDRFPLVLPVEQYQDGFLGLNLHYINPRQRIVLLDKLSEFTNNSKYDKTTRFRLSYDVLKSATKIYEQSACLKRYLYSNIGSRFLKINADEWDIAALLPFESFIGASSSKVFSDSRKKF